MCSSDLEVAIAVAQSLGRGGHDGHGLRPDVSGQAGAAGGVWGAHEREKQLFTNETQSVKVRAVRSPCPFLPSFLASRLIFAGYGFDKNY